MGHIRLRSVLGKSNPKREKCPLRAAGFCVATSSSLAHASHARHSSNSSFAASSVPARLSVRRLPGKCSVQNHRPEFWTVFDGVAGVT